MRNDPESRLAELGWTLPAAPKPVASYVPGRCSGRLLWVSGQIPMRDGQLIARGAVPREVTLEVAQECARQCVLNGLAAAKAMAGSLAAIGRVIRVGGWVACDASFTDQPKVMNGASDALVAIFGEAGQHARAAVGANVLPLGAPVEVEFLFELNADCP